MLKAYFDHKHSLALAGEPGKAFVPDVTGENLEIIDIFMPNNDPNCPVILATLTVERKLNKLAPILPFLNYYEKS